ncbi:hypothetical protein DVH24_019709 [Malus domestica]|uniref:Uncharacterized protein n=1 Tax=Malus domestica TaxID=3750 RepID=A0A498I5Q9_MALDO|nr:hypothetical protein DVH24_019709 [Malus domestica]
MSMVKFWGVGGGGGMKKTEASTFYILSSIKKASTFYILSSIKNLVCRGGNEKDKGLNLLHFLKHKKLVSVMECRERVEKEVKVLPSKHIATVEMHKALSQSDPIEISGAMTNSVAAIRVAIGNEHFFVLC